MAKRKISDSRLRERANLIHQLWSDTPPEDDKEDDKTGLLPDGPLLRTRQVALLFQVSERAVTDWARRGMLPSVRTPGGHRRYPADAVREKLEGVGLSTFSDQYDQVESGTTSLGATAVELAQLGEGVQTPDDVAHMLRETSGVEPEEA